ncbi:DUF1440 domain-containing protein [Sulfitobacter sp. S223]|uniref:DUF1440 domain-containing protein n=1 Tax=Sulfitobacter sp. S223 TaxID=2867023 RepID=UPI0021A7F582|nr:DUF1440 domain-containing protein [Sulfitobacter sp. S223]UWR26940.1 DUF1440 domain-containing protein [Sulfitobacter sp. S223]
MIGKNSTELRALASAGLIGEITFEAYAWLVSPLLFGVKLEPANLVIGLTKTFTGSQLPYAAAFAIHFLIGSLGFAAVVYLIKRVTKLGYLGSGITAGLLLWFVAQGMLAPLMGRTFMMGFGSYTQSSLIGHVGMTALIALLWAKFQQHASASQV